MRRAHGRPNFRRLALIHISPHRTLGKRRPCDYINLKLRVPALEEAPLPLFFFCSSIGATPAQARFARDRALPLRKAALQEPPWPDPDQQARPVRASKNAEPVEALFGGRAIVVRGAREHNLKNVDLTIPRDKLVVFTGLSGSGKSSLAFDTIYAEGQRRYVESLSAYARQFLEMMQKPDVDQIDGLSPAIAIEQKTTSKNPRSTVGTVTEIHDYMRLLWARVGIPYSPATGLPIESQTVSQMVDRVLALPERTRLYLLAPVVRGRKGEYRKEIADYMKRGFQRLKIDGQFYEIADAPALDKKFKHDIEVVVDRIVVRPDMARAPRRELRDGARSRRRPGGGRIRRQGRGRERAEAHPVLVQVRLSRERLHHPRDRAQAVLVQQSVRRLPGLRGLGLGIEGRRLAGRPQSEAHAAPGGDRALGEDEFALLPADARGARAALQVPARQALERIAG